MYHCDKTPLFVKDNLTTSKMAVKFTVYSHIDNVLGK